MSLSNFFRTVAKNIPHASRIHTSVISNWLYLRGLAFRSKNGGPVNVYHATVQKTGSQWIKAIFSDPRVVRRSRLLTYPQHRYEWNEFHRRFPKGTFVPGLYMSYDLYEEIEKPKPYSTFYVLRDPRDILISWYYSAKETHTPMGKIGKYREALKKFDFHDGISYCIEALQLRFAQQRTWITAGKKDPHVLILRYEDLIENPFIQFKSILNHCRIQIEDQTLREVTEGYSFERMKKRDLKKREGENQPGKISHYRSGAPGEWRQALTDAHVKAFYNATGDLIDLLGYPR